MQYLQGKTQDIMQKLNSVNKNQFTENEYLAFIKKCKIYDELSDDNLKEIFRVLQKQSKDKQSINKQQFLSILKKLNNSIILNQISIAQLTEDQLTLVIENLKIIHGDFSLKREVSTYQKYDFYNFILQNNFESKIMTIKVLDTCSMQQLSLLNLKDFYEKLEKQIVYDQTQQEENQSTLINQSDMYQSQISEYEVQMGFIEKVKKHIDNIIKIGNFQNLQQAQANKSRDILFQIIPDKFNNLIKQLENNQDKTNDLEMKLVSKEQKIKTLCNHLDSREIELNSLENEIRNLKQDKMVLQNQLRGKESYNDQQEDKFNNDIKNLVDQLESANRQLKEKTSQINLLENQYQEIKRMYDTNQKSLEDVRRKSTNMDQQTFDLIKYKNESQSLKNELQIIKEREQILKEDYKKLLEQKDQQNQNYMEECQNLRNQILKLEKEKLELERQMNDNIDMSIIGSIRDSVRDSIRDYQQGYDNYDSMIDVKRRLAERDDVIEQDNNNDPMNLTNDFNPILEQTQSVIQQNNDETKLSIVQNNFKDFADQKKQELLKRENELHQEKEKNNKLTLELNSLKKQLESKDYEIKKLQQQVKEIQQQNQNFIQEKENLMQEIQNLAKDNDNLKQSLKASQQTQITQEKPQDEKIDILQSSLNESQKQIQTLEQQKQKLEFDIKNLSNQLTKKSNQNDNKDESQNEVNKQIQDLQQQIQQNLKIIEQKDQQIQQLKDSHKSKLQQLNMQINQQSQQLKLKETQLENINQQLQKSNQQQQTSNEKLLKIQNDLKKEQLKNQQLQSKLELYQSDLKKLQEKQKKLNSEILDLRNENRRKSLNVSLLDNFQFTDQSPQNSSNSFGKESIIVKDPKLASLTNIFEESNQLQTQQNQIFNKKKNPSINLNRSQNNAQLKESVLIQNIITKNKNEEPKKDKKLKTYSYDHIEVAQKPGVLKLITEYQSCKTYQNWFSDLVTRVNSRNHHTSKILVVTELAIFIFSNQKQLKKKIELLDIKKIIHNKSSNYICICQNKDRDVLQVLRKEELLLFIRRKLKNLKSKLKLVERQQFVKQDYFHNYQAMNPDQKKFGKEFNNVIQIASRLEKIVMIKIDKEGMLFDSTKEILALLTDFGIICLSKGSKKAVDFIPLGEAKILKSNKKNVIIIEVIKDKKRYLTFISNKERDLWFSKIQHCQEELIKLNSQM